MEDIAEIIQQTAKGVVIQLEAAGMLSSNKTAYQKTEWVLKNYKALKAADSIDGTAARFMEKLDKALETIARDDDYYEIIPMTYFENKSSEEIAEYFDVSVRSVRRNKTRLLNCLKVYIFADTCIKEILLG